MEAIPSDQTPPPKGRLQFSMRHVLAFVLAASVLLALVSQLKHIGFVAFCYLAGMAVGWRLRRGAIFAGALTGLLVFCGTYLASWRQHGYASQLDGSFFFASHELQWIADAISTYRQAHGELPDSLGDLASLKRHDLHFRPNNELVDPWGHPYYYRKADDGFKLASLGRDGRLGGQDFDADLFLGEPISSDKMRLTFSRFIEHGSGGRLVFLVALIASLAAASVWRETPFFERPAIWKWIAGVVIITGAATLVAVFLAAIYLAASQSGH